MAIRCAGVFPNNQGQFHDFQWQDLVAMTNYFNPSAGGGTDSQVEVCIEAPIENQTNLPPFNGNCFQDEGVETDAQGVPLPCVISFKGPYTNTGAGVRGYPAWILGSRDGGNESWGRGCGNLPILTTAAERNIRDGLDANRAFPIYDHTASQAATGFPTLLSDRPSNMRICANWQALGDPGTHNVFTDTYLHDVSTPALLPVDANGNVPAGVQDTINGMSDRDTKMWNFNFWYHTPSEANQNGNFNDLTPLSKAAATGGTQTNTVPVNLPGVAPFDIYLKHETGGNNNFFYVGIVFVDNQNSIDLDYSAITDWYLSTATGPGTFLTDVYNSTEGINIRNRMAAGTGTDGVPKVVRPPDTGMVLSSLQLGTEMWGTISDDANHETRVELSKVEFQADGETFGKISETVEVTASCTATVVESLGVTASCTAFVFDGSDCDCSGFPTSVVGPCEEPLVLNYTLPLGSSVTGATVTNSNVSVSNRSDSSLTLIAGPCTDDVNYTGTVTVNFNSAEGTACFCQVPFLFRADFDQPPVSEPIDTDDVEPFCEYCGMSSCVGCQAHISGFYHNNWCLMEDAELVDSSFLYECDGNESSSVNACDCSYTQSWKFREAGVYDISIPENSPVHAVILWGHNLHVGTDVLNGIYSSVEVVDKVTGNPIQPLNWSGASATVTEDKPVIMYFDGTDYNQLQIRIVGGAVIDINDPCSTAPYCIDNIFIGECLTLPEALRKFASPFNATEYKARVKASACGPLSRSLVREAIDVDLTIEGLCYDWLVQKWRPFRDYLMRYPVYFSWSKNRYPSEVARVWLEDGVEPTEFSDSHFSVLSLALKAQISQGNIK